MTILYQRPFRCCLCLHVRTGTIFLGVAQILLHLTAIAFIIFFSIRYDPLGKDDSFNMIDVSGIHIQQKKRAVISALLSFVPGVSDLHEDGSLLSNSKDEIRISSKVHDTGLSNSLSAFEDKPDWFEKPSEQQQRTGRKDSPYFTLCLTIFSLLFCCFLVHGAATRQPTLLLPFFCLQVFDFIVAILSIVGLMSSKPDICIWFRLKNHNTTHFTSINVTFLVIAVSCIALGFKAYCLGMVWDCYKYLMYTNGQFSQSAGTSSGSGIRFLFPALWTSVGSNRVRRASRLIDEFHDPIITSLTSSVAGTDGPIILKKPELLPAYEEALQTPINANAPPPYFKPNSKASEVEKDQSS